MEEVWKDIKEYEGLYQISNLGRVCGFSKHGKRKTRGIPYIMSARRGKGGYLSICLVKNRKRIFFLVHRLVAMNFLPNPHNCSDVGHLNHKTNDNIVNNLEWCTHQRNCKYTFESKHYIARVGVKHPNAVLTDNDIKLIRDMYKNKDYTQQKIADLFNIKQATVSGIISRKAWKHL